MKKSRGFQIFRDIRTPLVHAVGDLLKSSSESTARKSFHDHVWITMDTGLSVRVLVAVNSYSVRNGQAGFDPRIRVGIQSGVWEQLPERGINECHRFSYDELSGIESVDFLPIERGELEKMLSAKVHQAFLMEVWGTPYHREIPGIHQIHSRKGSCATPESLEGSDGALRLYFREGKRLETFLFKFCGQ